MGRPAMPAGLDLPASGDAHLDYTCGSAEIAIVDVDCQSLRGGGLKSEHRILKMPPINGLTDAAEDETVEEDGQQITVRLLYGDGEE
jgi:hypothetical protein